MGYNAGMTKISPLRWRDKKRIHEVQNGEFVSTIIFRYSNRREITMYKKTDYVY